MLLIFNLIKIITFKEIITLVVLYLLVQILTSNALPTLLGNRKILIKEHFILGTLQWLAKCHVKLFITTLVLIIYCINNLSLHSWIILLPKLLSLINFKTIIEVIFFIVLYRLLPNILNK